MLTDTAAQIIRYADIECAVAFAGEDIDGIVGHSGFAPTPGSPSLASPLRGCSPGMTHYFFAFFFLTASVRSRSALSLMKPAASFWS